MVDNIITAGAVVTAVVTVAAFMIKVYKFIRSWERWVEEKDAHDKDNYMSIQQLKIMSPFMPLSERIRAGERYIACGGNGEVKCIYNELIDTFAQGEDFNSIDVSEYDI
jgi:hypothetical protein